jgi:hypothetical protein
MRFLIRGMLLAGLVFGLAAPVSADGAWVDRIEGVSTVLAVRQESDFPVGSLMRAVCDDVQFVQQPDGSGVERLRCHLSTEPVMIPAFQGVPPTTAFTFRTGPCAWASDYWTARDGSLVFAERVHYVVTPGGLVNITAFYAAQPTVCEEA